MERPGVVWVYSILVAIGIISNLIAGLTGLANPVASIGFIASIIIIGITILQIIFISKFFMLKKDCITWLFISFGLGIIINAIILQLIWVVIMALFGWAVWDYVSHKKVNGHKVFT